MGVVLDLDDSALDTAPRKPRPSNLYFFLHLLHVATSTSTSIYPSQAWHLSKALCSLKFSHGWNLCNSHSNFCKRRSLSFRTPSNLS
jgi:hypothetical protein